MTEKELRGFWYKRVKLTCIDGDILEGIVCDFTSSADNEPDEASIYISTNTRDIEILSSEIKSIEEIN